MESHDNDNNYGHGMRVRTYLVPPCGLAPGMPRVGGLAAATADSDIKFEGCPEMIKRIEE